MKAEKDFKVAKLEQYIFHHLKLKTPTAWVLSYHQILFREAVPRSNITSNHFTVVLLHDKHTESGGGTGCCSGLWVILSIFFRVLI